MYTPISKSVFLTLWICQLLPFAAFGEATRPGPAPPLPALQQVAKAGDMPQRDSAATQRRPSTTGAMEQIQALELPALAWSSGFQAPGAHPCGLLMLDPAAWELGLAAARTYALPGFQGLQAGMAWSPGRMQAGGRAGQAFGLGFRRSGDALYAVQSLHGAYARSMGRHWQLGLGIGWEQHAFGEGTRIQSLRLQLGLSARPREGWWLDALLLDPHWPRRGQPDGPWLDAESDRIAPGLQLASRHQMGQALLLGYGLQLDLLHTGMPRGWMQVQKAFGPTGSGNPWQVHVGVGSQPLLAWYGLSRQTRWGTGTLQLRWHPVLGWGGAVAWSIRRGGGKPFKPGPAAADAASLPMVPQHPAP